MGKESLSFGEPETIEVSGLKIDISKGNLSREAWLAVLNFTTNKEAVAQVLEARRLLKDSGYGSVDCSPFDLGFSNLKQIYHAYEPIAVNLIKSRIRLFPTIRQDEEEEIVDDQRLWLWEILLFRINWEELSLKDRVASSPVSLVRYLIDATGSRFAQRIIDERNEVYVKPPRIKDPFGSDLAEILIDREEAAEYMDAIAVWMETENPLFTQAVLARYLDDVSVSEQAELEGAKRDTIKARVAIGKRSLAAELHRRGITRFDELMMAKDSRWLGGSRRDLLEKRRQRLLPRYPAWKPYFPSKTVLAIEVFYGLGGREPLYDYEETSRVTGISIASLMNRIPCAFRIITGKSKLSLVVQQRVSEEKLYELWSSKKQEIALGSQEATVLEMYYEQNLSFREIGKRMNFCEESARRRFIRAIQRINVSLSFLEKPFVEGRE